jgi:hypothetical protein
LLSIVINFYLQHKIPISCLQLVEGIHVKNAAVSIKTSKYCGGVPKLKAKRKHFENNFLIF